MSSYLSIAEKSSPRMKQTDVAKYMTSTCAAFSSTWIMILLLMQQGKEIRSALQTTQSTLTATPKSWWSMGTIVLVYLPKDLFRLERSYFLTTGMAQQNSSNLLELRETMKFPDCQHPDRFQHRTVYIFYIWHVATILSSLSKFLQNFILPTAVHSFFSFFFFLTTPRGLRNLHWLVCLTTAIYTIILLPMGVAIQSHSSASINIHLHSESSLAKLYIHTATDLEILKALII